MKKEKIYYNNNERIYGYVPYSYSYRLAGMPVYDSKSWDEIQNFLTAKKRLVELMQDFCEKYNNLLQRAQEIGYKSCLLKCVESGYKIQLMVKYRGYHDGIDCGKCGTFKHRGMYFTDWLRRFDLVMKEMSLCTDVFFITIPDELANKLKTEKIDAEKN